MVETFSWTFDPKIFPKIHEASGGIPRRVNQIATRLLLMGAVEQRSQIDCAMLDQVVEEMARDSRSEEAQERKPAFSRPAIDLSSTSAPPRAPTPAPAPKQGSSPPRPNDDEMSDLRAAIATLSRAIEGSPRTDGDLAKRVEALETRLEEQEQSVRYLLQLLIEWLDRDGRQKAA